MTNPPAHTLQGAADLKLTQSKESCRMAKLTGRPDRDSPMGTRHVAKAVA